MEYSLERPENVEAVHIVFDSDLERVTLQGDRVERCLNVRANVLLDSPQTYMPKTLCREFKLEVLRGGKAVYALEVSENRKRSYHVTVNQDVDCIRLVPLSNWGGSPETPVFSFDFK